MITQTRACLAFCTLKLVLVGGAGGGSVGGGCLPSFMSVGASEESDVFTRCSLLFLLAYKNL